MKKITLIVIAITSLFITQQAKSQTFDKGTLNIDLGMGVPYYAYVAVPPVYGNVELGIHEYIGLGATAGFYSLSSYWYATTHDYYERDFVMAGFASFHYTKILKELDLDMGDILDKMDLYVKLGMGPRFHSWNEWDYVYNDNTNNYEWIETPRSRMYIAGNLNFGFRYFFTDNIAVNLELGGGFYSYTQFGITFKLK